MLIDTHRKNERSRPCQSRRQLYYYYSAQLILHAYLSADSFIALLLPSCPSTARDSRMCGQRENTAPLRIECYINIYIKLYIYILIRDVFPCEELNERISKQININGHISKTRQSCVLRYSPITHFFFLCLLVILFDNSSEVQTRVRV